jgi:hypothetical protein
MQVAQMKGPYIASLWKKVYPVRFFDCHITLFPVTQNINYLPLFQQNLHGVNYEDNKSIILVVDPLWWLKHESCKYMLMCLVHKENPDLSTKPTTILPGITYKESWIEKVTVLAAERVVGMAKRPPPSN